MEVKKNEYWIVDIRIAPGTKVIRTIINIYRIDKEGDIAFTMCGDDSTYWRSQFEWFDLIKRVNI